MNEYVEWLIANHCQSGILIDSNILLLLVVGYYDPELIARFRRTDVYLPEDFVLAAEIVEEFERVVTPHSILTEVSNLSGHLSGEARFDSLSLLGGWIHMLYEHQILGIDAANLPLFPRLGLTDTAIIHVALNGYLVFTDDFPLSGYLETYRLPVLNFNHVWETGWAT